MEKKEVLKTAKQVLTFAVSVGSGAIVANIIAHTSPAQMNVLKRACVGVGGLALGCMVSDKAVEYTEEKVDELVEFVQTSEEEVEETTEDILAEAT